MRFSLRHALLLMTLVAIVAFAATIGLQEGMVATITVIALASSLLYRGKLWESVLTAGIGAATAALICASWLTLSSEGLHFDYWLLGICLRFILGSAAIGAFEAYLLWIAFTKVEWKIPTFHNTLVVSKVLGAILGGLSFVYAAYSCFALDFEKPVSHLTKTDDLAAPLIAVAFVVGGIVGNAAATASHPWIRRHLEAVAPSVCASEELHE